MKGQNKQFNNTFSYKYLLLLAKVIDYGGRNTWSFISQNKKQ